MKTAKSRKTEFWEVVLNEDDLCFGGCLNFGSGCIWWQVMNQDATHYKNMNITINKCHKARFVKDYEKDPKIPERK
jgi:hypothetical protein